MGRCICELLHLRSLNIIEPQSLPEWDRWKLPRLTALKVVAAALQEPMPDHAMGVAPTSTLQGEHSARVAVVIINGLSALVVSQEPTVKKQSSSACTRQCH